MDERIISNQLNLYDRVVTKLIFEFVTALFRSNNMMKMFGGC